MAIYRVEPRAKYGIVWKRLKSVETCPHLNGFKSSYFFQIVQKKELISSVNFFFRNATSHANPIHRYYNCLRMFWIKIMIIITMIIIIIMCVQEKGPVKRDKNKWSQNDRIEVVCASRKDNVSARGWNKHTQVIRQTQ